MQVIIIDALVNILSGIKLNKIADATMKIGETKTIIVKAVFADAHTEEVTADVKLTVPDFLSVDKNVITAIGEGTGSVTVEYTDFTGNTQSVAFQVNSLDPAKNNVLVVSNSSAGKNIGDRMCRTTLLEPLVKGKVYVVKAKIKTDKSGSCAPWFVWSDSPNKDQDGNSTDVQKLSTYRVTDAFKNFKWEFTASYPHDILQFAIGQIAGNVYFDEVSCMEKGADKELVYNGDFEFDDLSKWEILNTAEQTLTIDKEVASGIMNVSNDANDDSKSIYDLQGRSVSSPVRGIYIQNGRKIVAR